MATKENKWVVMKSKKAPNSLEGLQNLANKAAFLVGSFAVLISKMDCKSGSASVVSFYACR